MRDLVIMAATTPGWLWATFRGLKYGFRRRRLVPLLRGKVFHGGRY